MMDQKWFEMPDVRGRKLNNAVWIPLRSAQTLESTGKRGYLGFREEFFGVGSIAVPLDNKVRAETLGWHDIGLRYTHRGGMDRNHYVATQVFDSYALNVNTVPLRP